MPGAPLEPSRPGPQSLQQWLHSRLVESFGVDDCYVDYLVAYLDTQGEQATEADVKEILEALITPEDEGLRTEFESFTRDVILYHKEPDRIPPAVAPTSFLGLSPAAMGLDGMCPSSLSPGGWIGCGPATDQQEDEAVEEEAAACGAGLEGLCLSVAEAALYDDDDEEEGSSRAVVGLREGAGLLDEEVVGWAEDEEGNEDDEYWQEGETEEEAQLREIQLAVLCEAFPQCSPDSLMVVVMRCGLDVDLAASSIELALNPPCQPCRYYMAGFCARSDCTFSHDLSSMTCTYWLLGTCRHDDSGGCTFLHDVIPHDMAAVASGTGQAPPSPGLVARPASPTLQADHFPALPSASSSSSSPSPATAAAVTGGSSSSSSSRHRPGPTFLEVLRKSSAGRTAGHPSASSSSAAPSTSSSSLGRASAGPQQKPGKRRLLDSMWAMGGDKLKATYTAAREAAATAARARNALFIQGTEAFQRGDKAAASTLSARGREMNALMREKHREAALHIFAARNPSPSRVYKEGVLDLHGLHVQEAVELLDSILPALIRAKVKEATILTGSGHHSGAIQRGQARLFPAVEGYVHELASPYSEVVDRNGHKGGFTVTLSDDLLCWWQADEDGGA